MRREKMLDLLAMHITARTAAHPLRVAVDGIDAAGKTILADALVEPLRARGRNVIRASSDGFHRPRSERYRLGSNSPQGYYLDAFDYAALRDALLVPLGPGGSRHYRRAVFDLHADCPLVLGEEMAAVDAVLLVDGIFLLRPELAAVWDYRIFVEVPFAIALERARRRDAALFGSVGAVQARYERRYFPAQRSYFELAHPQDQADAVVWKEDPLHPLLSFRDDASPR